jgi:hypothetical protein
MPLPGLAEFIAAIMTTLFVYQESCLPHEYQTRK